MNPGAGAGQPKSTGPLPDKSRLRTLLLDARAHRADDPNAESQRLQAVLAAGAGARVVAAYVSRPGEPDTTELLSQLHLLGVRVLLPVLTHEPDWAWFTGPDDLVDGPFGIRQPTSPKLGASALGVADWIWLPGLAGTPNGDRLGTGGGWYDRALLHARRNARRGLLLYDDEVRDWLPIDPWDQPVDVLVTERRVITCRDHESE